MANGQDRGRPGQYQQGSGQQYPQQQPPWQPQPYHPDPHRQRFQGPPPGYGQVQPYAPPLPPYRGYAPPPPYQGYAPYAQPQYAAPQYAPAIAPKSTGTGLVLGLLLPGVGCMYAGRPGMGIAIMVTWLISITLVFVFGIGFLTGFATWIASAVLGYTMTREWNAAHGIVSLSAGKSLPIGTFRNILDTKSNQRCTTCKPGASTRRERILRFPSSGGEQKE
jgi:TM2 domain-containing membrane protein YozV